MSTIDVEHLYPSIDHDHLLQIVSLEIRRYYTRDVNLATLAVHLLEIVLKNQFILFEGIYFQCIIGIATGLSCGVYLANIYLSHLDNYITSTLRADRLLLYRRFVDDIFIIVTNQSQINETIVLANSWKPGIRLIRRMFRP